MCLIVTIVLLLLSIESLANGHFLMGSVQLLISFGFLFLLLRNIRQAQCDRTGKGCESGCSLIPWIAKVFKKK
ncbi:MAG: hypothetical protein U9N49_06735 [Campylobacterota bacterium]|nr:hypothetical protein [Campylobacterota bacterium]